MSRMVVNPCVYVPYKDTIYKYHMLRSRATSPIWL